MKKRVLSAALAASMAISMTPAAAFAAPGAEGHWAEGVLDEWMGYGVVRGFDDGTGVHPDDAVTRAEFVTMLDRVMGYKAEAENVYSDVALDWYTDYVLRGVAAGVIKGDDNGSTMRPNDPVTRQEACVILARVLDLDVDSAPDAGFSDQADIADWAQGAVNAMKAAGYVAGNDGEFRPNDGTTRAEAVKMLDNIFAGLYQESGEYTGDVDGSAVVSADGVDLKGQTVEGDLVVSEGVDDGHVELDGVTVEGRLIVRGGGVNSVVLKGGSKVGEIVVDRQSDPVRVAVEDGCEVGSVTVAEDTVSLVLEGSVPSVSVETPGVELSVAGEVGTLTVAEEAEGAKVSVEKGAVVSSLVASAPKTELSVAGEVESVSVKGDSTVVETVSGGSVAKVETDAAGTVVKGEGEVGSVVAGESSSGVVVSTEGTKVENKGSGAVTDGEGGTVAKPGEEATTPGGSTSGGGSTGGGVVVPETPATLEQLKATAEAAPSFKYDDYEYAGSLGGVVADESGVTVSAQYTQEQFNLECAMNDMARYLGALHRVEDSSVVAIKFNGDTYTWSNVLSLKGSNWVKDADSETEDGNTLVSAIVDYYQAHSGAASIDLSLVGKGGTELPLSFKFEIVASATLEQLKATAEAAPSFKYDDYEYAGSLGGVVADESGVTVSAQYTQEQFNLECAMNDMARYLGALHRVEDSSVVAIKFNGDTYTWSNVLSLKGSNWVKDADSETEDGNTLVSAIVDYYQAHSGAASIDLSLVGKGGTELPLSFKFAIA